MEFAERACRELEARPAFLAASRATTQATGSRVRPGATGETREARRRTTRLDASWKRPSESPEARPYQRKTRVMIKRTGGYVDALRGHH